MTDPRYPGSGSPYGGGYPPPDPYGGQGQPGPYGQPDPYGSQPGQYGQPAGYGAPQQYGTAPQYGTNGYAAPTQYGSPYGGYGSPNPYDQPSPFGTPPKKGSGAKVALIVIGALVLVAVVAIGGLYIIGSNVKKNTSNTAATGAAASAGSSHGTASASPTPVPKNTDPTNAKVGDCLAGETMDSSTAKEVNDVRLVSCTSTDAKYKVVGIVPGKTETQFDTDDNICNAYPTAVSELWQGRTGETGSVLCLAPAKK